MNNEKNSTQKSFQLRQVVDMYWLINMAQSGVPYERPLELNEAGAMIWKMLQENAGMEEISEALVSGYGVLADRAETDVRQFVEQLETYGYVRQQAF